MKHNGNEQIVNILLEERILQTFVWFAKGPTCSAGFKDNFLRFLLQEEC